MIRVGLGLSKITPPVGTPLGGNARLNNYATGIWRDLYTRALWIEDSRNTVCLIALDLLALWQAEADRLRQAVACKVGLQPGNILIASTHTHSGPDTMMSM